MTQASISIANTPMPIARTAVNSAYEAITTRQSGPTQPATTFPFMEWVDTSTSPATQKVRNAANNAWVVVGTMDTVRLGNAPIVAPTFTGVAQCTNTAGAASSDFSIANTAHVKAALVNHGAWQTPSLQNGWTAGFAGNIPIAYRISSNGFLYIKGQAANNGTVGTSSIIFTLPVGFRPTQLHQSKLKYIGSAATVMLLQIDTNGNVSHIAGTSLSGIAHDLDFFLPLT